MSESESWTIDPDDGADPLGDLIPQNPDRSASLNWAQFAYDDKVSRTSLYVRICSLLELPGDGLSVTSGLPDAVSEVIWSRLGRVPDNHLGGIDDEATVDPEALADDLRQPIADTLARLDVGLDYVPLIIQSLGCHHARQYEEERHPHAGHHRHVRAAGLDDIDDGAMDALARRLMEVCGDLLERLDNIDPDRLELHDETASLRGKWWIDAVMLEWIEAIGAHDAVLEATDHDSLSGWQTKIEDRWKAYRYDDSPDLLETWLDRDADIPNTLEPIEAVARHLWREEIRPNRVTNAPQPVGQAIGVTKQDGDRYTGLDKLARQAGFAGKYEAVDASFAQAAPNVWGQHEAAVWLPDGILPQQRPLRFQSYHDGDSAFRDAACDTLEIFDIWTTKAVIIALAKSRYDPLTPIQATADEIGQIMADKDGRSPRKHNRRPIVEAWAKAGGARFLREYQTEEDERRQRLIKPIQVSFDMPPDPDPEHLDTFRDIHIEWRLEPEYLRELERVPFNAFNGWFLVNFDALMAFNGNETELMRMYLTLTSMWNESDGPQGDGFDPDYLTSMTRRDLAVRTNSLSEATKQKMIENGDIDATTRANSSHHLSRIADRLHKLEGEGLIELDSNPNEDDFKPLPPDEWREAERRHAHERKYPYGDV